MVSIDRLLLLGGMLGEQAKFIVMILICIRQVKSQATDGEDEDVARERENVTTNLAEAIKTQAVVMQNLTKVRAYNHLARSEGQFIIFLRCDATRCNSDR